MMPLAIVSIIIIYYNLVKYFRLSQRKKILLSVCVGILYYVIIGACLFLLDKISLVVTKESFLSSYFWCYTPVALVLGLYILYIIQYLMAKKLGYVEFEKTTIVLITIGVFLLNCITPTMLVLLIGAGSGS